MEGLERMRGKAENAERKVERLSEQIMKALASTIDAKDKYTNGHSFRVAEYAEEMLRRSGGSFKEQEEVYYMGLLHDIGKIGIDDIVLRKETSLEKGEMEYMKTHSELGGATFHKIRKNFQE